MNRIGYEERKQIEKLLNENITLEAIASIINFSWSAVYYELRRCVGEYDAESAQKDADEKAIFKLKRGIIPEFSPEKTAKLHELLRKGSAFTTLCIVAKCSSRKLKKWLDVNGYSGYVPKNIAIEERFQAIEQQIEIILDLIKGFQK
jgi:hypothetical protein